MFGRVLLTVFSLTRIFFCHGKGDRSFLGESGDTLPEYHSYCGNLMTPWFRTKPSQYLNMCISLLFLSMVLMPPNVESGIVCLHITLEDFCGDFVLTSL